MDVNTPRELIVGTDLEDIQKEPLVFTSKGHRLKLKPFMNGALGRVYLVHQYVQSILNSEQSGGCRFYPVIIKYGDNNHAISKDYAIFQSLNRLDAIDLAGSGCKVGFHEARQRRVCWDFKSFQLNHKIIGNSPHFYLEGFEEYLFFRKDLWERITTGRKKSDFANVRVYDYQNNSDDLKELNIEWNFDKHVRRGEVRLLEDYSRN